MGKLKMRRPKARRLSDDKKQSTTLLNFYKALNDKTRFPWFGSHTNASCLKCDNVAKLMIRVGCLIFCYTCFNEEFDSKAKHKDQKKYKYWLDEQSAKWEEELE